jgi:hypothetical protein
MHLALVMCGICSSGPGPLSVQQPKTAPAVAFAVTLGLVAFLDFFLPLDFFAGFVCFAAFAFVDFALFADLAFFTDFAFDGLLMIGLRFMDQLMNQSLIVYEDEAIGFDPTPENEISMLPERNTSQLVVQLR